MSKIFKRKHAPSKHQNFIIFKGYNIRKIKFFLLMQIKCKYSHIDSWLGRTAKHTEPELERILFFFLERTDVWFQWKSFKFNFVYYGHFFLFFVSVIIWLLKVFTVENRQKDEHDWILKSAFNICFKFLKVSSLSMLLLFITIRNFSLPFLFFLLSFVSNGINKSHSSFL